MLKLNRFAWIALLHALLAGCTVPQPQTTPATSQNPCETSRLETHLTSESSTNQPLASDSTDGKLPVGDSSKGDLSTDGESPSPSGISRVENHCLDMPSDAFKSWLDALYSPSPGRLLRFAMRLSEASDEGVEKAIWLIEHSIERRQSDNHSNKSTDDDDIYSYHLARLYEYSGKRENVAEYSDESKSIDLDTDHADKSEDNASSNHLKIARDLYAHAATFRRSPYYHLARAREIELSIEIGDAEPQAIAEFIATYPDYPGLSHLRYAWAKIVYEASEGDSSARDKASAIETMQSLAFWNPKDRVSTLAKSWLESHGIEMTDRSYEDIYRRVDNLRKIRFWDEAETAANEALATYRDNVPLLVESGRIAYERSDHALATERFEKLFDFLDGETIDKVRPNGVRGYITRAYAYRGDCAKALDVFDAYVAHYGKKAQIEAKRDFALACGDIETAYRLAQQLDIADTGLGLNDFAFIAYIARDYATARRYYTAAIGKLTGTYKRRATYFLAQATLKAAREAAKAAETKATDIGQSDATKPEIAETKATGIGQNDAIKNEDKNSTKKDDKNSAKLDDKNSAKKDDKESTKKDEKKSTKKSAQKASKKDDKKSAKKKGSKKPKKSAIEQVTVATATVEAAKRLFQSIIDDDSNDYYAILAWSRLDELSPSPSTSTIVVDLPNGSHTRSIAKVRPNEDEYTFDERALIANFDADVEKFAAAIPELRRVQFLHHAELYRERNALFRQIAIEVMGIARLANRPTIKNLWTTKLSIDGHLVDNRRNDTGVWGMKLSVYAFDLPAIKQQSQRQAILERQTAIYDQRVALREFVQKTLIGFHDYYLSRRYTPSPKKTCGSPDNSRECAIFYPHAYSATVRAAAQRNGIHPELVWAIMNIESAFNHDSISHANAYGLLQIIPMTGYKVADALGIESFGPYDLIKPEVSIAMGTWYFAQILHKFQGYATLSMAAYNGGPHQVARWLTAYSGKIDHDAFIELIPYNEARNYVKKGMARLLIFERIDSADPKNFFAIPNTLPSHFEAMPNY